MLLLAVLYFLGLRAYRARGGRLFPSWRPPFLAAGVLVVVVALLSPVDLLADYSFTWHMLQHQWLMMVAAPFILLGAPFVPVIRGIPAGWRRRWFVPFARNRAVRAFFIHATRPVLGLVLMQGSLVLWHYPPLYDLALRNEAMHYLEHFCFVFTAILFWWNIVTPYPFRSRLNFFLRLGLLMLSSIINGTLGALITFSDSVLYGYGAQVEFWGLTMHSEQELGGILMWVGGAMMHLAAITAVFFTYAYHERKKEPPRAVYIRTGASGAA